MRLLMMLLIMFVCAAGPAVSGPREDREAAVTAYEKGDYATALRLSRSLANQGSAVAQWILGLMYANGEGVPQDYAAAVSWYQKAADQGLADVQLILGLTYFSGRGGPQDYVIRCAL